MNQNSEIKILAFGITKDIIGNNNWVMNGINCLSEAKKSLYEQFPQLETIKDIQFAINEEYITDFSTILNDKDVVALIPPVSGG